VSTQPRLTAILYIPSKTLAAPFATSHRSHSTVTTDKVIPLSRRVPSITTPNHPTSVNIRHSSDSSDCATDLNHPIPKTTYSDFSAYRQSRETLVVRANPASTQSSRAKETQKALPSEMDAQFADSG